MTDEQILELVSGAYQFAGRVVQLLVMEWIDTRADEGYIESQLQFLDEAIEQLPAAARPVATSALAQALAGVRSTRPPETPSP